MARPRVEVVHVGSACRDVAPEDPRGWRLGGGVTYASLTTARLGLRTAAIVGVDADRGHASELDMLRDAGVDLLLVPLDEGPIFHNLETPKGRVQTSVLTGVPLPVPAVPESWLAAPGWSLVPVAGELTDAWADAVAGRCAPRRRVAGLPARARGGGAGPPPAAGPVGDHAPRRPRRGQPPRRPAQRRRSPTSTRLLHPGADLLVTQGADGGLLIRLGPDGPTESLRYLPTATDRETDPTGAGDTFLAALAGVDPAAGGRRPAPVSAPTRPALRGRGGVARRRGAGPRRRAGSGGRPVRAARADPRGAVMRRPSRSMLIAARGHPRHGRLAVAERPAVVGGSVAP